ncbi:hypothetical protein SAMN06265367_103514 [Algoriphagus winogradskyi]|uniref:Uncharacterized protein n=1 Tax=Algoriphagus winogradskyi TaxID=237017 RepID=A0ABY1NZQ4_9BACT|nr:hypothetical protein SAMN06265367_103514 [Algoriphagus winogradskyi]
MKPVYFITTIILGVYFSIVGVIRSAGFFQVYGIIYKG